MLRSKIFDKRQVVHIELPPTKLAGRTALIRIKQGTNTDITSAPLRLPPAIAQDQRQLCDTILLWTAEKLRKMPRRTTPIVCTDANVQLAPPEAAEGWQEGVLPHQKAAGPKNQP